MARPLRRVVIRLAIKLGIAPREVEQWSMADIRDCVAELLDQSKPQTKEPEPFDEAKFEASFNARCG